MVYLYDESLINKFNSIFSNSKKKIYITNTEDVFNLEAYLKDNDTVKLPIISIVRSGTSLSDNRPHYMKFNGLVSKLEEGDIATHIKAIPIRISYQIDVWTESRLENDLIVRELVFYFSTNPTLSINIPYNNANVEHVFNIFIDNDIEDNSDISEHKNRGRYFRQTLVFYTDDAYMWKADKDKLAIVDEIVLDVKNDGSSDYTSEIIDIEKKGDSNDKDLQ